MKHTSIIRFSTPLLCISMLISISFHMQAQVTIGTTSPPSRAALLDLKTQDALNPATVTDKANVTSSKGGLILPRVKLKDTTTLEPFIPRDDPDWLNDSATKVKEAHAGLTVYNLENNNSFLPGIYTWDGAVWKPSSARQPFAANGLTRRGDTISMGGLLTQPTELDMGEYSMNIHGEKPINLGAALNLANVFKYTFGQPGKGKVLISDDHGNAEWQNNNALATTPSASFDTLGANFHLNNYIETSTATKWANTHASLTIPPGKWFVMVTIFANLEGGVLNEDVYWLRSSFFLRETDKAPEDKYFPDKNMLISARVYPGKNIISGYVTMENKGSTPLTFLYMVGRVIHTTGRGDCYVSKLGSSSASGNSIVAFALY